MDLRNYYRRVREIETQIVERDAVVVSEATPDGGRSGRMSEVPRAVAARLVADGKARLATTEEAEQYRHELRRAYEEAEEAKRAARPSLTFLSESELKALRGALKGPKAKE